MRFRHFVTLAFAGAAATLALQAQPAQKADAEYLRNAYASYQKMLASSPRIILVSSTSSNACSMRMKSSLRELRASAF